MADDRRGYGGGAADYSQGYGRREDREHNARRRYDDRDRDHDDHGHRSRTPPGQYADPHRSAPPRADRARDGDSDERRGRGQRDHRDRERVAYDDYSEDGPRRDRGGRDDGPRRERERERERVPYAPTATVIVKGVPPYADRAMVWESFSRLGALLRDVRMAMDKYSDQSRDFAFVEFQSRDEAMEWVEGRRGEVTIDGRSTKLDYSRREAGGFRPKPTDWICGQCGEVNWARRDACYRCNAPWTADCRPAPDAPASGPPLTSGTDKAHHRTWLQLQRSFVILIPRLRPRLYTPHPDLR